MLSAEQYLLGATQTDLDRFRKRLLTKAAEASKDIVKFFEFVIEEEHSKQALKIAPHQRVGLHFMMNHERSVNIWGIGTSKTFATTAMALFMLGQNCTLRGAVVSATQAQASKPVGMVRDYIESNAKLRLVFPHLVPSSRSSDPWTQTALTVERPPAIRDPSLVAIGEDSRSLAGARLSWILADDLLNQDNTATKSQRDKTYNFFSSIVKSRLDPVGGRIMVTNSAWHPDDLLHRLEKLGWPTMKMDVYGDITVLTPPIIGDDGKSKPDMWGIDDEIAPFIRQAADKPEVIRLTEHDPDPGNTVPLWPHRYPLRIIEKLEREHPFDFKKLYRSICRDDEIAQCKTEWIELCKQRARDLGVHSMVSAPTTTDARCFTGIDLAISPGEESDDCSFFTFELYPNGMRRILDIDVGKFDGPTIVEKAIEKHKRYNSIIRVENNGAQEFIRQFIRNRNISIPVKPHTTGRNKAHPEHGVLSIFVELSNGAWLLPNDANGRCHPNVQRFIDECLYYAPSKHTGDVLMSAWFCREQARLCGATNGDTASTHQHHVGRNITAR